jgi:hypothetical protein
MRKNGMKGGAENLLQKRSTNGSLEELRTFDAKVLPYTRELWDGLVAIEASIKAARKTLSALVERKDFAARVEHLMRNPHEQLFSAAPGRRLPPTPLPLKRFGGAKR